jgi:hypothetical protein
VIPRTLPFCFNLLGLASIAFPFQALAQRRWALVRLAKLRLAGVESPGVP